MFIGRSLETASRSYLYPVYPFSFFNEKSGSGIEEDKGRIGMLLNLQCI
jgi:hypothetical protein